MMGAYKKKAKKPKKVLITKVFFWQRQVFSHTFDTLIETQNYLEPEARADAD